MNDPIQFSDPPDPALTSDTESCDEGHVNVGDMSFIGGKEETDVKVKERQSRGKTRLPVPGARLSSTSSGRTRTGIPRTPGVRTRSGKSHSDCSPGPDQLGTKGGKKTNNKKNDDVLEYQGSVNSKTLKGKFLKR